jgi:general stress protein YciG
MEDKNKEGQAQDHLKLDRGQMGDGKGGASSDDGTHMDGLDKGRENAGKLSGKDGVPEKAKLKRGFASMSPDEIRKIASKGGKASHASGNAHQWSSDAARVAGQKGGKATGKRTRKPAP